MELQRQSDFYQMMNAMNPNNLKAATEGVPPAIASNYYAYYNPRVQSQMLANLGINPLQVSKNLYDEQMKMFQSQTGGA